MNGDDLEIGRSGAASDLLLLAGVDRAERHLGVQGVQRARIAEHLGLPVGSRTTGRLRPLVEQLIGEGLLVQAKRHGNNVWGLTDRGRRKLARARRQGKDLVLPEAPQHRRWRYAREQAQQIDRFAGDLEGTLTEALKLLGAVGRGDCRGWSVLSGRLRDESERLCWAMFCLEEWQEPVDERPDIDVARCQRELRLNRVVWPGRSS